MGKTQKNKIVKRTKTKKCKHKIRNPTSREIQAYCPNQAGLFSFKRFEEDYEKGFKTGLRQSNKNVEKELIKMFNIPYAPTKINEKSDYYSYINYQWLEKKTVQLSKTANYFVQLDSFRVVQDKVYHEVIDLVKDYIKVNNTPKSRALSKLYNSLVDLDDAKAQDMINESKRVIDKELTTNNIYTILGCVNHNELISWGCPIVWNVFKDDKDSSTYISYISAPQLTIYDYKIYIEDEDEDQNTKKYKKEFKNKYFKFIDDMFDACLGKGHGLIAQDVWDCEFAMLSALGCDSIKNEDEDGYNAVNKNESVNKCGLDWNELARQIGYKNVPDKYICSSLNYVQCILKTLTKDNAWKSKMWRTYYYYISFRQVMRFHNKWRLIHYEFFGKFIKGSPIPMPREIYPIYGLSLCFDKLLSVEYIKQNHNQERVDYVHNMCADLLVVFKRIIKRNTWLSPKTKKYALKKLDHINVIVGRPDTIRDDIILDYNNKGAYQNLEKMAHDRVHKLIHLDGKSSHETFPVIDWSTFKLVGKQPYIVNAFYTPTENSIYVPLAYLQKPFIDLNERGIEYNLAYIGYTLAHEMSHCLDDLGSKYNYKGNLENWWTKADRKQFNLKVKDVIKQYEQFASYDGIKMDASLSTGENLADISGLGIIEEYLRDFQDKNKDPMPIRESAFNIFFIYIAIQARQKIYDAAVQAQLKTNPHPMDKYRTNCPLARLELFKTIYNIKKGDKMYWPNNDTIW